MYPFEDELRDYLRRERPHASYFDVRGDKEATERGVFNDWLVARFDDYAKRFKNREFRPNPLDPPDVVLIDCANWRHGIELTELVDGPTISARMKKLPVEAKEYSETEIQALIAVRVVEKGKNLFKDDSCVSKTLVIYSDEPSIVYTRNVEFLPHLSVVARTFFDEIWFMIPPAINISGREVEHSYCRLFKVRQI